MNIKSIFNTQFTPENPVLGSLLVAEPFMQDKYFRHSVICLIDYESKNSSAMGIVLNKPTPYTLDNFLENISVPVRVYLGGPVSTDRLYFLHSLGDIIPGGHRVTDGLWVGGDFEAMENYINSGYDTDGNIRFFIGYSGWSEGQLENEMKNLSWAVVPKTDESEILTESGDTLWHSAVKKLGDEYRSWRYHPCDIRAN